MSVELDAIFLPRISDDELRDLIASNPPLARCCSGCAYTVGTEAHSTPTTAMMRDDCDRTGHPFWCHMHKSADDFSLHLCRGWLEARATPPQVSGEE